MTAEPESLDFISSRADISIMATPRDGNIVKNIFQKKKT